jgi:ubiquinone/menaquinone biosynthesis C-methylase UbiE
MSQELKKQIKEFWDKVPCGTGGIPYPEGTKEYYEAIAQNRFKKEFYIADFVDFERWRGKKVLEIGCGAGSDLIKFAQHGADITGIDLSSKSIELASKRLEVYGLSGKAIEADAETLQFEDNTFDAIYSCGVLHHTPDIIKAISEVRRVLKPDGEIRIMLYHRPSIVCLQMWILFGLLKGNPFKSIDDIFYNNHESVGTKVLTVRETHELFKDFKDLDIKTIVTMHDIRYARNRYLPAWFMKLVPHSLGWNLLIKGKK